MPPNLLLYLLLMSHLKLAYIWEFGCVSAGSGCGTSLPCCLSSPWKNPSQMDPRLALTVFRSLPQHLLWESFQPRYVKQQLHHSASPSCFAPWHVLSIFVYSLSPTVLLDSPWERTLSCSSRCVQLLGWCLADSGHLDTYDFLQ